MALTWILRGELYEKVDDLACVGPAVVIVTKEDDECGFEGGGTYNRLEVGPETEELRVVAVDVSDADDRSIRSIAILLSHLQARSKAVRRLIMIILWESGAKEIRKYLFIMMEGNDSA